MLKEGSISLSEAYEPSETLFLFAVAVGVFFGGGGSFEVVYSGRVHYKRITDLSSGLESYSSGITGNA
jgi:hypothetical protein